VDRLYISGDCPHDLLSYYHQKAPRGPGIHAGDG
jgi:hypothetical protein